MRDLILYAVVRSVVVALRLLPLRLWLCVAQGFGGVYYYIAGRKNQKALTHLRLAFPRDNARRLKGIIRQMHMRFAQNLAEALYLPAIDEKYVRRFVHVSGIDAFEDAVKNKKGLIFLGTHAGSWELAHAACAMLFPKTRYAVLARPQPKYQRTDEFLNDLRRSKGCQVIRVTEVKKMVEHLAANNSLGMVVDHGGQDGLPVEFFGKLAMTPPSSVKLAKKLGAQIVLAFMRRRSGPHHEMIFRPYELVDTGDAAKDVPENLRRINKIFEEWIVRYPQEYMWSYKRWKYSPQRNILVLSDGTLGHLKQSLSLVEKISGLGFMAHGTVAEVKFRTRLSSCFLSAVSLLAGPRPALSVLRACLEKDSYEKITSGSFDLVVSTGSSLASVNCAVASAHGAKSISVMKPGILPISAFSLVVIPEHDKPRMRKNVVRCIGSLNSVTSETIKGDFQKLVAAKSELRSLDATQTLKIGLLLGGNSKNYELTPEIAHYLCQELKRALDELDALCLITTSRRTPERVVEVVRKHFGSESRCRLLVVANDENPPGTVGGIFYLSDIVIVSGESISMVSEAAACGKHVVVFEPRCKNENNKVRRFLNQLVQRQYIYLSRIDEIYQRLRWLVETKPLRPPFDAGSAVADALKKIV